MSSDDKKSALFAGLVLQQSNAALMFLGKIPNPETGQTKTDIESAQFFIDVLELLEERTRGNLTQEEDRMLKSTLTSLRMAFVEAVNRAETTPPTPQPDSAPDQPQPNATAETPSPTPPEEESRKKFTKKY